VLRRIYQGLLAARHVRSGLRGCARAGEPVLVFNLRILALDRRAERPDLGLQRSNRRQASIDP
jgi:hypothetical protein